MRKPLDPMNKYLIDTEHYLKKHGKRVNVSVEDRRRMKRFFEELDVDNSGQISTEELLGPLLSVGMANNEADVRAFHSNFACSKALIELLDGELGLAVRVSIGRRKRLLDTIRSTLPNLARIEELRHAESQDLQRERRKLQRANAANAKLISALEHAVRVDQQNMLLKPKARDKAPRFRSHTSFLARQRRPRDMMPLHVTSHTTTKGRPYVIV